MNKLIVCLCLRIELLAQLEYGGFELLENGGRACITTLTRAAHTVLVVASGFFAKAPELCKYTLFPCSVQIFLRRFKLRIAKSMEAKWLPPIRQRLIEILVLSDDCASERRLRF